MAAPPQIRHVHYDNFFALISQGVSDLAAFRRAIDQLLAEMGDPAACAIVIDVRTAVLPPLPKMLLVQAMAYLYAQGLGRQNRVALVCDRNDHERRDRAAEIERIAQAMEMRVRSFDDYALALDWLSEKAPTTLEGTEP
jgi:hypothetical protein